MTDDPLPAEHLSPLATLVDEVLAGVGYEVAAATDAIDDAVPGYGGLFDPATTPDELHRALESLLASGLTRPPVPEPTSDTFVLYVDGSSRGNPGPAGAGAVIVDAAGDHLARLGRPVGSRTGNNTAEYVRRYCRVSRNTSTRIWPTATRTPPTHWRRSEPISRPSDRDSRVTSLAIRNPGAVARQTSATLSSMRG